MFKKIPEERKQTLLLKIKPIIANQLGIAEEKITLVSQITEDLGAERVKE